MSIGTQQVAQQFCGCAAPDCLANGCRLNRVRDTVIISKEVYDGLTDEQKHGLRYPPGWENGPDLLDDTAAKMRDYYYTTMSAKGFTVPDGERRLWRSLAHIANLAFSDSASERKDYPATGAQGDAGLTEGSMGFRCGCDSRRSNLRHVCGKHGPACFIQIGPIEWRCAACVAAEALGALGQQPPARHSQ